MPGLKPNLKKILVISATISLSGLLANSAARADASAAAGGGSDTIYLQQIAAYTNSILTAVTTPTNPIVLMMLEALLNLSSPDNSTNPQSPTPALQNAFTNVNFAGETMETAMMALTYSTLQNSFFSGIPTASVPYINDLAFGSMIGMPAVNPDPRGNNAGTPAYNYIKMASGMNLVPTPPGLDWKGSQYDQTNYRNYYNVTSAVQSFNGYALSQVYADTALQLNSQQAALVAQVSDPKAFFSVVASETMGAVVRQILMFESQNYAVLTQILQAQKLQLTAITMNNTLQMVNGMSNASLLIGNATTPPAKAPGI